MPPFTVASLATITHSRPSTTPMPVTIPADGAWPSYRPPGGERVQLEEGRVGVDEPVDALPRRELPARAVPLERLLAAAARDLRRPLAQLRDEAGHPLAAAGEQVAFPLDLRRQHRHRSGAYRSGGARCGKLGLEEERGKLRLSAGGGGPRPMNRGRSAAGFVSYLLLSAGSAKRRAAGGVEAAFVPGRDAAPGSGWPPRAGIRLLRTGGQVLRAPPEAARQCACRPGRGRARRLGRPHVRPDRLSPRGKPPGAGARAR